MPPRRKKLLSHTRPKLPSKTQTQNLSSKTTQTIISKHHTLQKRLNQAKRDNHAEKVKAIEAEIETNGGLQLYQQASTQGQSKDRGGDTSKVLVEWLGLNKDFKCEEPLRILEVGALSTANALSIPSVTDVRRVDLHSQDPLIEEHDFMAMDPNEVWQGQQGYDILSLSLVVNYVPTPSARGDMLRRTANFLRHQDIHHEHHTRQARPKAKSESGLLPALFLVLPLPCLTNSRYLTEPHLEVIMSSLGYRQTMVKRSAKLHYSLWRLDSEGGRVGDGMRKAKAFKKTELRTGQQRNNFCIVLDVS